MGAIGGLVDYVSAAASRTKVAFTKSKSGALDYLMKYELKNYFGGEVSEEEKQRLKSSLEKMLDSAYERYDSDMGGVLRKAGSKITMGLDIANQIYGYIGKSAVANVSGLSTALFAGKTLAEIPAMYKYLKKSKDWYGAGSFYLLKPIRWLLPVIGPALESGAFERMVMRGVMKEAKYKFIKEHGEYVKAEKRIKENMKQPLREITYLPEEAPELVPMRKAA
jgi:hypothetical protein